MATVACSLAEMLRQNIVGSASARMIYLMTNITRLHSLRPCRGARRVAGKRLVATWKSGISI